MFKQSAFDGDEGGVWHYFFPCVDACCRCCRDTKTAEALSLSGLSTMHRTNYPLEAGGWIYQRRNGQLILRTADRSRRMSNQVNLRNPPPVTGARLIALFHTHPFSEVTQIDAMLTNVNGFLAPFENTGPSFRDTKVATSTGVPNLVVYEAKDDELGGSAIWRRGVGPERAGFNPELAEPPVDGFPGNSLDTRNCR